MRICRKANCMQLKVLKNASQGYLKLYNGVINKFFYAFSVLLTQRFLCFD